MLNRRGFITGLASLIAAPAIVRPESLMKLWVPSRFGGFDDDHVAVVDHFLTDHDMWLLRTNWRVETLLQFVERIRPDVRAMFEGASDDRTS